MYAGITLYKDCEILISQINYNLLHPSEAIICITHTLSVEAFLTLRTLTPFGKWNSWFSKSVLKNVVCVRGSVKDMPTSLTTDVLSFSTLSLVVPCWNTTWNKIYKEESSWSANMMSHFYFAVSIYSVYSPDYCFQQGPGPGLCGLRLCFYAVGEQCPCPPSA